MIEMPVTLTLGQGCPSSVQRAALYRDGAVSVAVGPDLRWASVFLLDSNRSAKRGRPRWIGYGGDSLDRRHVTSEALVGNSALQIIILRVVKSQERYQETATVLREYSQIPDRAKDPSARPCYADEGLKVLMV